MHTTQPTALSLPKAPTGIAGLDEISQGGLPRGRPTLVAGNAGCGKTLLAMQFLVEGIRNFDEPGVFICFEETPEDLALNAQSLGFDLADLEQQNKLVIDHIRVERSEISEAGEYDLEGLFIRLALAVDSIGAKRIVLDTLESLFSGLSNPSILRAELRRLFFWLKERNLTAIVTGESGGTGQLTRQGLEEYVTDCVLLLDHRVSEQISTRRLRIVKYRGTAHGTNEYPFLIDEQGIHVMPVSSLDLDYAVSDERISSGVPQLDEMLGGAGFYRGSTILLSGSPGTGKTSLCGHFAQAAVERGEKVLYFAFEEPRQQLFRNLRSIGLDLEQAAQTGRLVFHASRPSVQGLEAHLATITRLVDEFRPDVAIFDPFSNLSDVGTLREAQSMMLRLLSRMKARGTTLMLVNLTSPEEQQETTAINISSVVDTWILLRDLEMGGERNRAIYVLKSRGMKHSHQIREFLLTDQGIQLREAYLGENGVLTGSLREAHEERSRELEAQRRDRQQREELLNRHKVAALQAQILALQAELAAAEEIASDTLRSGERELERRGRADVAQNSGHDQNNG